MTGYCCQCVRTLVLAISITTPSFVAPSVLSSTLQVQRPNNLRRDGGYDHREALFGVPPYGSSIVGFVQYAGDDLLCNESLSSSYNSSFILMIDRGGCTFVQKIRNGQRSGAAAVIIADNVCLCEHANECPADENGCEEREPIMADDGSGGDISIPSMLMFKQDADPIKDALQTGTEVKIEMSWDVPETSDHVEFELWTTPMDELTIFERQWKDAAIAFKSKVTFTPHLYVYDGLASQCRSASGENECYNLCTNVGRYCCEDPDKDLEIGISGADVVTESLRRLCIWEIYGMDMGTGLEYWEYLTQFEHCDDADNFMNEDCVDGVMSQVGVDITAVNKCMEDSGGLDTDTVNSILQKELDSLQEEGINVVPIVYVNNVPIRGALDFDVVFEAVCAGFADGTKPDVCSCIYEDFIHDCVASAANNNKNTSKEISPITEGDISFNGSNHTIEEATTEINDNIGSDPNEETHDNEDFQVPFTQPTPSPIPLLSISTEGENNVKEISTTKDKINIDSKDINSENKDFITKSNSMEGGETETKNSLTFNSKALFLFGLLSGIAGIFVVATFGGFFKYKSYSPAPMEPESIGLEMGTFT